jgi:hypothetical protein
VEDSGEGAVVTVAGGGVAEVVAALARTRRRSGTCFASSLRP